MKSCTICGKEKSAKEFRADKRFREGFAVCAACEEIKVLGSKRCSKCGIIKEVRDFYLCKNGFTRSWCRKCHAQSALLHKQKRRAKDPEKFSARQKHLYLLYTYGLSLETWKQMFEEQKGVCAICGGVGALVVDHVHATGRIRGLLCHKCNTAIGMLKDSIPAARALVLYLEKFI